MSYLFFDKLIMKTVNQLRRRALIADAIALVMGMVLLFLGTKQLVPSWVLMTGTVIAVALIVFTVVDLLRVRRLEQQMLKEYIEQERRARRSDDEVEPAPEEAQPAAEQ